MLIELDFSDVEMKTFLERKGYFVTKETYICNRMHIDRDSNDKDFAYYQDDALTEFFAYVGEKPVLNDSSFAQYLLRVVFNTVFKEHIITTM